MNPVNNTIILSSNQTHRLHHTFFVPKDDIKATLLVVHGMCEHSGRYEALATFLADQGILVATYDQLGHGLTAKDESELGFFDEKHPVQTLCKDVVIMADRLKQKADELNYPNTPHYILGHSMGSFIVRTVLCHHAHRFDGVILMGTSDTTHFVGNVGMPMLSVLNRLYPKHKNTSISLMLNQYLLNKISSPISASRFAWLSENTQNVRDFEADPLCGFIFTNNGFVALNALTQKACRNDWLAHLPDNFAILLLSGKDDPVGNMGVDVANLHKKIIKQTTAKVKSQLYVNMRHEPHQETDRQTVFDDIAQFCLSKHHH